MKRTDTTRILVVTDHPNPPPALISAIKQRAKLGPVQFRVVVPNPAPAEIHLLHPERHAKALEAEKILSSALHELELATGGRIVGSVSVRHDPMDAVEETLFSEPIDEIIVSVAPHGLAHHLHQDLANRLDHFGLPIIVIPNSGV
jgi:hypothetical protein